MVGQHRCGRNGKVMPIARELIQIGVSEVAAAARLVDYVDRRSNESVVLQYLLNDAHGSILSAAGTVGNDKLYRLFRFPAGRGRTGIHRGHGADKQKDEVMNNVPDVTTIPQHVHV